MWRKSVARSLQRNASPFCFTPSPDAGPSQSQKSRRISDSPGARTISQRKYMHDPGTPDLIYHVVQVSVWSKAAETGTEYFPPTYAQDGFIHATHDGRLLVDVLNHFYKDVKDDFLCLELDSKTLTSPVKMEAPAPVGDKSVEGGPAPVAFPHIYGPISPLSCVTRKLPVLRSDDGTFLRIEDL